MLTTNRLISIARVGLLAAGFTVAGCYPASAPPPVLSGEHASELSQGHDLFTASCNRCHGYPDLTKKPDEHWPHAVERMGKKAHLDAAGQAAVLHYILAYRAESAHH
jgi:mono/diheme cytochrome c family protein